MKPLARRWGKQVLFKAAILVANQAFGKMRKISWLCGRVKNDFFIKKPAGTVFHRASRGKSNKHALSGYTSYGGIVAEERVF
jgi:hypothetical protein